MWLKKVHSIFDINKRGVWQQTYELVFTELKVWGIIRENEQKPNAVSAKPSQYEIIDEK